METGAGARQRGPLQLRSLQHDAELRPAGSRPCRPSTRRTRRCSTASRWSTPLRRGALPLPNLIAFGEDVGQIGDVNQGFAGLQAKYGPLRVTDTGIRETTIMGQAIGMALRGLRPIAEIQYLDYVLYGLQILSDDLATLRWRTKGRQKAPVIVRTRGHRLEGIWHSGSPMAGCSTWCAASSSACRAT